MKTKIESLRWSLADLLSFIACKLRGQPWYLADNWAGVHGNRAAELRQSVWERCVALEAVSGAKDPDWIGKIDHELTELGQIAGENWGHKPVYPEPTHYPLFKHMADNHGLTLLDSELDDICRVVDEMKKAASNQATCAP